MSEYFVLYDNTGRLNIDICAKAVDSITRLLLFKGMCMYLPEPSGKAGAVILFVNQRGATESETEWFIRTLAGHLRSELLGPDGVAVFADSPDNDPSFLDVLPAPENESNAIHLTFTIDGIDSDGLKDKLEDFFDKKQYALNEEADGYTVFICANSFLDIYILPDDCRITGDIDLSASGAGVYSEVAQLADSLAEALGADVTYIEDPRFSYTVDRDFDKLRRSFYLLTAHQLAFAIADDREGEPAYFGWGTDTFEPEHIMGTVVTPLGRYDISKLRDEIVRYGFSYVCDTRFLSRNTPAKGSDFYIKEALNLVCNSTFSGKSKNFSASERMGVIETWNNLELALESDRVAPFPTELYLKICSFAEKIPRSLYYSCDYSHHFTPGYFREYVRFGFGHYLRRFKVPPGITREELNHGCDVFLNFNIEHSFKAECEISYGYTGDGTESPLGDNFAIGSQEDIEIFDIGGTSVVRFLDGGLDGDRYLAEAEVYIADEVYRFAAASRYHEDILEFREMLRDCVSVEDWYDENVREEFIDPHAYGATFCTNGITPECKVFQRPFPMDPFGIITDRFNMGALLEEIGFSTFKDESKTPQAEDSIAAASEKLKPKNETCNPDLNHEESDNRELYYGTEDEEE